MECKFEFMCQVLIGGEYKLASQAWPAAGGKVTHVHCFLLE